MFYIKNFIHKHKLLTVMLAALLTVVALMLLIRFSNRLENITVSEQNGVYDLRKIDLTSSVIRLLPGSTYYPDTYLLPETVKSLAPVSREEFSTRRSDYLSQRFVLLFPDDEVYSLTFQLSGRHALRVYVNGKITGESGQLGVTKSDTQVWENNITISAPANNEKMEIILQAAQFYHTKRGASLAELYMGKQASSTDLFAESRVKGLLVMGGLLSAAVSLLGTYLLLARTKATLYFALACLAMALREAIQSQAWTYFPISGNLSFMLEYLSLVLLTIFLTLYLGQYADNRLLKSIQLLALTGSTVYGLCVLFGDSIFYTSVLIYYQSLLLLCIIPGVAGLFYKIRHSSKEQMVALYGIGVFFLSAVMDIVMYLDIFRETKINLPVSEATMLIFALAQVFSLYLMNNRVLSEEKEAKLKLLIEKAALEDLNRLKTEFLGNVSHELKTPLTVISGYAQTVNQLSKKPEALIGSEVSRRMILISSEAERLSLMISQVLDVTRMDEGQMVMEPVRCYVEESIHSAVSTHYPILNKNRNQLNIRIESGLPPIYADPARLSQVIVNLISNAVRFTKDGIITISVKQTDTGLLICISDTGCGIPADQLSQIFERYVKKHKSSDGQDTGTGLGLYICKYIIDQHGGNIWLESEVDHGTSVFFTLPTQTNTAPC